jgi:hypothetical protein
MRFSRTRLSDALHIKHALISNLLLSVMNTNHIAHSALALDNEACSFSNH